ncbi:MAG: 2,3-bisphosphoglycerate-independent phosphoglycerate mutase [Deltaproteobacteria bacterium]|nr:MAG: 2,3-bisphosphoglycerate-independent phosphoglycerate mutase [Deltaproteobacteria bacterium]
MNLELRPHPRRVAPPGPVVCVVLDGVGIGRGDETDAVALAHTPWIDHGMTLPSATKLLAHGRAVGMPSDKDMGNSEVGHNALGAGRVFDQGAKLVDRAIESGALFEGETFRAMVEHLKRTGGTLHLVGLLSDGNVHSHIDHVFALLDGAKAAGIRRIRLHVLLDGRDVPEGTGIDYVRRLEAKLESLRAEGVDARIASGGGRMVTTMDRYESDWSIVERGWRAHVLGDARPFPSAEEAVETLYRECGRSDQHMPPFVVVEGGRPVGTIEDGDAVVFWNFRGDRAVEISRAFEEDDFRAFDRVRRPDVFYAGMMQYDGDLHIPKRFLVAPPAIDRTMGELLAHAGKVQLACAETHKFGHVTYFWNGNRSGKFSDELEDYVEVPSGMLAPGDHPWMKAGEVVDAIARHFDRRHYDFVRVNFANGDMVGHTGDFEAARLAVACVDFTLGRLRRAVLDRQGVLVVTADHGNADHMFDRDADGRIHVRTSHSLNPVPFWIEDPREAAGGPRLRHLERPGLANVAATCLELLGFLPPEDYEPSLLAPTP